MAEHSESKGVLHSEYAQERKSKPELIYRFKTRAAIAQRAVSRFLDHSGPLDILDFGCADGLTLQELCRILPCREAIGVEFAEDLLAHARNLDERITLIQGDVTQLPEQIKAESRHLVTALALLEHLPSPDAAAREAFRVLKPGGLFIYTCPNPFWDDVATAVGLMHDDQHEVEMDKKTMIALAKDAGFELMAFWPFMWAPVGFLPYLKLPISPSFSLGVDSILRPLRLFDFTFVNQCVVAKKPR